MSTAAAAAAAAAFKHPATVLYSHALQSIFAFATLKELVALMSVSKEWHSAVLCMRPSSLHIHANWTEEQLLLLCASRVRRHISSIGDASSDFISVVTLNS